MNSALQQAIEAVEENNRINDARWSDWHDASDIRDTYEIEGLSDEDIAELNKRIQADKAA